MKHAAQRMSWKRCADNENSSNRGAACRIFTEQPNCLSMTLQQAGFRVGSFLPKQARVMKPMLSNGMAFSSLCVQICYLNFIQFRRCSLDGNPSFPTPVVPRPSSCHFAAHSQPFPVFMGRARFIRPSAKTTAITVALHLYKQHVGTLLVRLNSEICWTNHFSSVVSHKLLLAVRAANLAPSLHAQHICLTARINFHVDARTIGELRDVDVTVLIDLHWSAHGAVLDVRHEVRKRVLPRRSDLVSVHRAVVGLEAPRCRHHPHLDESQRVGGVAIVL
mmetsp:Transcript_25279/g.60855  ORF Transcript_25279/g.60855 Transcript_25279/m.60855 type:complete len:277 (+) Transcript_25279:1403-2233(+)